MTIEALLVAGALAFAVVTGMNNAATLVAVQLRARWTPPWLLIAALAAAVAVGPLVVGTAVANTVADRLTVFAGPDRGLALAIVLGTDVAVVGVLSRLGLPTSLFAALIAAIAGAGAGLGLSVHWLTLGTVFAVAAVAPWIGAALGLALTRTMTLLLARGGRLAPFVVLCFAYGTNGAQTMLALVALAFGEHPDGVVASPGWLAAVVVCFALGGALGLDRMSASVGTGLLAARPHEAVNAEVAAAVAVGGASAVGLPVSMTLVTTASLLGSGAATTYRRIRWRQAGHLAFAWLLTVPVSFAVAAVVAIVAGSV